MLARVLLAQDRPGPALAAPGAAAHGGGRPGRTGSVIEIQALQALALAAAATRPLRWTALAQALMLACPQGYVRVFADEGAPMAALLGRLVAAQRAEQAAARGVPLGYLARLLRAFGRNSRSDTAAAAQRRRGGPGPGRAAEPRELEVLRLLAAGKPNQQIAERAGGQPRHGQKTRQPRAGQARRGQPHRGNRPGPRTRPDPLTRSIEHGIGAAPARPGRCR